MRTLAVSVLLVVTMLPGCDRLTRSSVLPDSSGPNAAEPLRVAAASDLQAVLPVLIDRFTAETGLAVAPPTFGASGQLAEQIRQGAPFDLFLSANQEYVESLVSEGAITPDSVAIYARGRLVIAVHRDAVDAVSELADLDSPQVHRVAIANPEFAPYGLAARQALERSGLWDRLQPKLARAESVRQALQFVQSGNAEAGLVGQSIARDAGVTVIPLDDDFPPIPQALGILASSRRPQEAQALARFLLGGQEIFREHGFAPPETP
jgi:molybdate transport system substrate-binding protein